MDNKIRFVILISLKSIAIKTELKFNFNKTNKLKNIKYSDKGSLTTLKSEFPHKIYNYYFKIN